MARVEIDWSAVHRHTIGETYKLVRRITDEVAYEAKVLTRHGEYSTGFLSASIRTQVSIVSGNRVRGRIGSPLWYAMSVHDGAIPHKIRPINPGYPLKFFWRKVGHVVRFASVNHPGQEGQHYLSGPLSVAGIRYGFRVNIHSR